MKTDLLNGKPVKNIIFFAIPIMGSSLLQYCYGLVDNIIVGRYVGSNALAAVGNVGSINSFIIGAAMGLTAGFTIPVAQAFGAGNYKKMNKYAGNSISLSVLIGLIIAIIAHIICYPLLKLIHTPNEIIDMSASYVNIIYYCVPIQMSLNNFNALARATGDSKKPLYFLICSVVINVFLDLLFVGKLNFGVVGAAWATAISQFSATLLAGIYVLKFNKQLKIRINDLLISKNISFEQIKIGFPLSLQFTITSIGSMMLQTAVNGFGSNVIAGFTAAGRVEQVLNIPMSGLGVGTMTFVAQNYGAGNYKRIIKNVRRIYILDLCVSVVCSVVLITVGPYIVSLFMTEKNTYIMDAAMHYLRAISQCYSLVATLFVFRNTLQGLGFTYANTIAGIGEFLGRIVVALVLTPILGFSAICYAGPVAWLLADIPLIVIYLNKRKQFSKLTYLQGGITLLYYFVLIIGVSVSFVFCIKRSSGFSISNLLFKSVSSLFYLLTAVFALICRNVYLGDAQAYGSLIIMGGAFGLVGDIMLDLKGVYKKDERVYLNSGFVAFLIGHIFYISAIIYSLKIKWWLVLIGALIASAGGIITVLSANIMKVHYGAYRKIVAVYTSFLLMTAVTSGIAVLLTHFQRGYVLLFIGAVLFALSDVILSGTFFGRGKDKKRHYFINHFLYYAAQYLIAASVMLIK